MVAVQAGQNPELVAKLKLLKADHALPSSAPAAIARGSRRTVGHRRRGRTDSLSAGAAPLRSMGGRQTKTLQETVDNRGEVMASRSASMHLGSGASASMHLGVGVVYGTLELLPEHAEGLVHLACKCSDLLHHIRQRVATASSACASSPLAADGARPPRSRILLGLQGASEIFIRAWLCRLGRWLAARRRNCGRGARRHCILLGLQPECRPRILWQLRIALTLRQVAGARPNFFCL